MTVHFCVRVYANGESKHTIRDDEGLRSWLDYNRQYRPGNALFVGGVLPDPAQDKGYLSEGQAALVSAAVTAELALMGPLTAWRLEYDRSEGAEIYPERTWRRFNWPREGDEPTAALPARCTEVRDR